MVKASLRTKSVGTKVSDAEYAALEGRARAANLTLSEWVRSKLLEPSADGGTGRPGGTCRPGVGAAGELAGDAHALDGRVARRVLAALVLEVDVALVAVPDHGFEAARLVHVAIADEHRPIERYTNDRSRQQCGSHRR